VLSIATDSIFRSLSHSAIRTNSGVVAPKSATSRPLPSNPGAHTQCRSLPISMPATLARTMGSPAMGLVLPGLSPLFRLFRILDLPFRTQLPRLAIRGFCPRGVLQEPHQCSIAFLEPCSKRGIRTNGERALAAVVFIRSITRG
jgi:hypothetical protein